MAFPNIHRFSEVTPNPYGRQMGRRIAQLLSLFAARVADTESNSHVLELAKHQTRWAAGHAVFDEIRRRYLVASDQDDQQRLHQYCFEEACCQALYNAIDPPDPFDPSSAFFVVAQALGFAKSVGLPLNEVLDALSSA